MRRAVLLAAAALALAAAGCDVSDDEGDEGADAAPREVSTTRVQVVEGIGREGGFDAAQIYERLAPGVVTIISIFDNASGLLEGGEGGQGSGFVLDDEG